MNCEIQIVTVAFIAHESHSKHLNVVVHETKTHIVYCCLNLGFGAICGSWICVNLSYF